MVGYALHALMFRFYTSSYLDNSSASIPPRAPYRTQSTNQTNTIPPTPCYRRRTTTRTHQHVRACASQTPQAMAQDPSLSVETVLRQYARYHFGAPSEDRWVDALYVSQLPFQIYLVN